MRGQQSEIDMCALSLKMAILILLKPKRIRTLKDIIRGVAIFTWAVLSVIPYAIKELILLILYALKEAPRYLSEPNYLIEKKDEVGKGRGRIAIDVGDIYRYGAVAPNDGKWGAGRVIPINYSEALKWYEIAGGCGSKGESYFCIGSMYECGDGVEKDCEKALDFYRKSGELGDNEAIYRIGYFHQHGISVAQSYDKAMECYKRVSDSRSLRAKTKAICEIGNMYNYGLGVQKDKKEALIWYRLAEKSTLAGDSAINDIRAHVTVLMRDLYGSDDYRVAAKHGDAESQYRYGYDLYFERENRNEAVKWLTLANEQGHEKARELLLISTYKEEEWQSNDEFGNETCEDIGLKEFVLGRKIDYLVHFTRVENLRSILSRGLRTRENIITNGIDSVFNDEHRLDGQEDSISCSIAFPNYKMFYRLQAENPHAEWVVLLLDPSLLWEKDCAFSVTNAASSGVSRIPIDERKGVKALNPLFNNIDGKTPRRLLGIPEKYPTDPQAEVLVLEDIGVKYIEAVVTKTIELESSLSTEFPGSNFLSNSFMFSPRKDYEYWS